ncbi:isochorismate synthase [Adlercreutzia agrestimuris]|uniref:isochorismate synthase n=1 Tax=Adlercreutzia agrestimuris TaxID=2941324 RepID=UPI00203FAD5F|nr:isochorismate synthase [Adlercreutzia agrestimuris]
MSKIYSFTTPLETDIVDAFCALQKGFTDQFVYYRKDTSPRLMGLGRCVALSSIEENDYTLCGLAEVSPVFFSFNRFDASNPAPPDELFESFPRLHFMLPEIVLIENESGSFLQVNSLGPVYPGRVQRFCKQALAAAPRTRRTIRYTREPDSREAWQDAMEQALGAIETGRVKKVVLSRRQKVVAESPFSSKDLLVNLIDGPARGTVLMYRYADVFFCACTPELLVRKSGQQIESMCLAGSAPVGNSVDERLALGEELLADEKNREEHEYVVSFIREVLLRNCYDVSVPETPTLLELPTIQHLYTPCTAELLEGTTLWEIATQLHPTPAVAGTPVGEARMVLRQIEPYNRGFYAGACGYVDGNGDGEFSVALRSGVFDGEIGWLYAGCGVVAQSDAQAEYDEVALKLQTILSAFDGERS